MTSKLILTALASLIWISSAMAMDVVFQWDPNLEQDLAGYRLHYQAGSGSMPFTEMIDVGNVTSASLINLDPQQNYAFAVTAYNTAGQESLYSNLVIVNETVPPALAMTNPINAQTIAGVQRLSAQASDMSGVARVEFYVDGNLAGTATSSPYEVTFDTAPLANGNHTIMATAYDVMNNVSSQTVLANVQNDTQAPQVAIGSPAPGEVTVGTAGTVAVTATDNVAVAGVMLYINGALAGSLNTPPYAFEWTPGATGSYSLLAKAYDLAGNLAESASVQVTAVMPDTTPPSVSITSPEGGTFVNGSRPISIAAYDDKAVKEVRLYVNGVQVSSLAAAPFVFTWTPTTNGSYTITAEALDTAGNSRLSTPVTLTADLTAPVLNITSPKAGSTTSATTVTVSGSALDNTAITSVTVRVGSGVPVKAVMSGERWSSSVTLSKGTNTIYVTATDVAGNQTTATVNVKKR